MQASTPARTSRSGESAMAVVVDEVVVGHHGEGDAHVEPGRGVEDGGRGRPGVERSLRRLLDDGAVHHRVGERDADLDPSAPSAAAARTASLPPRGSRR